MLITRNNFHIWHLGVMIAALFVSMLWSFSAHAAAPTVSGFNPTSGSAGQSRTPQISITFNQNVFKSGATLATPARIRIFKDDGAIIENITASGTQVTINGATATISLNAVLDKNTTYYVQIEEHAFVNASDESYAGISNATTWVFKTIAGGSAQSRQRSPDEVPTNYDTEAPSLSDVGIFVPGTPASGGSSTQTETDANTAAIEAAKKAREKMLAEAAESSRDRAATATTPPVAQQYVSSLHERACKRVQRLFAGNMKMIDRVNRRLQGRFGFMCTVE